MKIDKALDDLTMTIINSEIYNNYCHVLKQVEKSKDINKIVKEIKIIQQQIVKNEYIHKTKTDSLDKELETKKATLYNIPLYNDYIEISEELNGVLMKVNNRLQTYIDGLNI